MSEWIKWEGGECPVSLNTKIEVEFRNGKLWGNKETEWYSWNHRNHPYDIVAYRVIKDESAKPDKDAFVPPTEFPARFNTDMQGNATVLAVTSSGFFVGELWDGKAMVWGKAGECCDEALGVGQREYDLIGAPLKEPRKQKVFVAVQYDPEDGNLYADVSQPTAEKARDSCFAAKGDFWVQEIELDESKAL